MINKKNEPPFVRVVFFLVSSFFNCSARQGQEPTGWDSIDVAYNINLDADYKAVEYYSLESPDYPATIEYENGRIKRISSQSASGIANFTYDERGNVIKIVADDVTSLAHQLTYDSDPEVKYVMMPAL